MILHVHCFNLFRVSLIFGRTVLFLLVQFNVAGLTMECKIMIYNPCFVNYFTIYGLTVCVQFVPLIHKKNK
jgi:hypothetical protein